MFAGKLPDLLWVTGFILHMNKSYYVRVSIRSKVVA